MTTLRKTDQLFLTISNFSGGDKLLMVVVRVGGSCRRKEKETVFLAPKFYCIASYSLNTMFSQV